MNTLYDVGEEQVAEVVEEDSEDDDLVQNVSTRPMGFLLNDLVLSYLALATVLCLIAVVLLFVVFAFMRLFVYVRNLGVAHSTISDAVNLGMMVAVGVLTCSIFAGGRAVASHNSSALSRQFTLSFLGSAAMLLVTFIIARFMLWRLFACPFSAGTFYGTCPSCKGKCDAHRLGVPGCECPMPMGLILAAETLLIVLHVWLSDPLQQSLHDMYRRRLVSAFFKNAQDVPLADIPVRPYFLCNVTVNNLQIPALGSRTVQPVFLSKDFCGGSSIGYWDSKTMGTYLSKGIALSGAAISPTSRNPLLKLTMMLLNLDLGEWLMFRKTSGMRRYLIRIFLTIPFIFLLLGGKSDFQEYKPQLYFAAVTLFTVPIISMLAWGVMLQCSSTNFSNWFLFVPFFKRIYHVMGFLSNKNDPYFYLTDGGDFDNLGVYELLRRGVHDIFIFDAGLDVDCALLELFNILTVAEEELGCTVDWEDCPDLHEFATSVRHPTTPDVDDTPSSGDAFTSMRAGYGRRASAMFGATSPPPTSGAKVERLRKAHEDALKMSKNCFIRFSVLYPKTEQRECRRGRIWYAKTTLTGAESEWIKLFALSDRDFPHHSTNNQMFSKETFTAYQRLGKFAAKAVFSDWKARTPDRGDRCWGSMSAGVATTPNKQDKHR
eukprot:TRINITY_DN51405_c0_g1_i1.p1 TRINITY_DN51405_c0_g1~~TRINITY_DN51405_c0_g1_i1.p1  ORF type:complete len:689 (+),score=38.95 TRINITY_DN51405_c0_g1_i1:95-2068(+)